MCIRDSLLTSWHSGYVYRTTSLNYPETCTSCSRVHTALLPTSVPILRTSRWDRRKKPVEVGDPYTDDLVAELDGRQVAGGDPAAEGVCADGVYAGGLA